MSSSSVENKESKNNNSENKIEITTRDLNLQRLITEGKNPRGIPNAKFIVRRNH